MTQAEPNLDPAAETPRRWLIALLGMSLVMLGLVAYANSYRGALVYDDMQCLIHRDALNEWWQDKVSTGRRRWLTHLTFVANHKLHGYWVPGFHVVNNLIHLSAGLCLFGLVRRTLLLPATRARFARSAHWIALAVAALWLVHPLQTESVTYVVQRLESLAGLLFLLTLYFVLRGAGSRWAWAWYSAAVAVVWIGTGSKETMFLAPLAVLFFDRAYLAESWRAVFKQRWALHAATLPALVWSALWLKNCFTPGTKAVMGFGYQEITPWQYLRTQPEVILHYLRLAFWPAQQCLDYGWRVQDDPRMIFGLGAIVLALVIAALVACWYRPRIGFVAFMFFFILAPTSSIMPIRDLAFEHRMYLSLASVAILVVLGLHEVSRCTMRSRLLRVALPVAIVVAALAGLTLRTIQRNSIYHDPVRVWQEVVVRSPWHARGAYNLGQLLVFRGMVRGGQAEYERLLLTDPKQLDRQGNRFEYAPIEGDLADAAFWFHKALELDPKDASAHFNLGGLHDRAERTEEAIHHYRQTLALNSKHLNARMNLARLLTDRGEFAEAAVHTQIALDLAPKDARPHMHFGNLLAAQGRYEEAEKAYRQAFEVQPQHVSSRYRLALALWALDRQKEAIETLRTLRLEHRNLNDVNVALARFLAETDDPQLYSPAEGAAIVQPAADANAPQRIEAHQVLALCQAELGRFDLAAATIDRGLALADPQRHATIIASLTALRERVASQVTVAP